MRSLGVIRTVARAVPAMELSVATLVLLLIAYVASRPEQGAADRDELRIHDGRIEAVAFAPDGNMAASASRDGAVKVWRVDSRTLEAARIRGKCGFSSVAFSADGRTLLAGGFDGSIRLWDVAVGRELFSREGIQSSIRCVAFSPDGSFIVAAGDDGQIRAWDFPSGRERAPMLGHSGPVHDMAFAADGKTLASVEKDGRVILWEPASRRILDQFDARSGCIWSIAFSPDGRTLAVGGSEGIHVRSLSDPRSRIWRRLRSPITAVRFLRDGQSLISTNFDQDIAIWSVVEDQLRLIQSPPASPSRVKALAVSPDGQTLVTGADDSVLRFYDLSKTP